MAQLSGRSLESLTVLSVFWLCSSMQTVRQTTWEHTLEMHLGGSQPVQAQQQLLVLGQVQLLAAGDPPSRRCVLVMPARICLKGM